MSLLTTAAALSAILAPASPSLEDYLQTSLKDVTFTAKKVKAVQKELVKINDDFGMTYKFDRIRFFYKEPLKLRLEATVEDNSGLFVVNGAMQTIKIPRLRIGTKQNLTDSPGRRQTPLDFGVLTPAMFKELFTAKFVRTDRATGDQVFDLTYQNPVDTSRHRIWVDPEKGITNKREWYNQRGRQLATFNYARPEKVNGVWIPTEVQVRNADNVIAGITRYETFLVNSGLSDSLFAIN